MRKKIAKRIEKNIADAYRIAKLFYVHLKFIQVPLNPNNKRLLN